jgi:hypothetical protein
MAVTNSTYFFRLSTVLPVSVCVCLRVCVCVCVCVCVLARKFFYILQPFEAVDSVGVDELLP